MVIVLALLGAMVGASLGDFAGALGGAALGYAIGSHLTLRRRVVELEAEVIRLKGRGFASADKSAPSPSPIRASEPTNAISQRAPAPEPLRPPVPPAALPALSPAAYQPISAQRDSPANVFGTEARPGSPEPDYPPLIAAVRNYFTGGNLVVRAGIIVLFFGVAFLLKFAADRNLMPIELRLAGVALGGAALLVIGWRLRERQRAYALAVQGGGVGLLYLTAFAALRLYELLPPTLTFALLVAVAGLSAFLAIGQSSVALAALGATGGFLAPILASTGQGDHVVLFSYYALLNAGIVAIAWFKAWRPLNVLAFVFTFAIGTAWGVLRYEPQNFASTEPFLALFFVMFVAVAVLFALRRAPRLNDYVDGTLVFGTPVMTMLLQSALVHDRPYAMAFSALTLSAVYLLLAWVIWRRRRAQLRLLAESFLALAIAFLTLAVPLALDGHWTAATWALEGAAIFWIGIRQDRKLAVASGVLLQVGAAVSFLVRHDVASIHAPLLNSAFVGAVFIAIGGLVTARVLHLHRSRLAAQNDWLATPPVYWALLWWFIAGIGEIRRDLEYVDATSAILGLATLTALGCAALSRWKQWREWQPPTLLLLLALALCGLATIAQGHLLARGGAVAWPTAVGAWFWLLRWRERHAQSAFEAMLHVATLWLLVALVSFELAWQVEHASAVAAAWHQIMWALPAAAALALIVRGVRRNTWPVHAFPEAYAWTGAFGLTLALWLWVMAANFTDGAAQPLPYLPIANPIELAQALALTAMAGWLLHLQRAAPGAGRAHELLPAAWPAFAVAVFAFLTAILLRLLHHYVGVPYEISSLLQSTVVQASLSIFWGLIALTAMVFGTRAQQRVVWFAGGALLGVVLLKMFLVDLSRTGTVARIVSFIGVGVLMLIIGRFSPVPPARAGAAVGQR